MSDKPFYLIASALFFGLIIYIQINTIETVGKNIILIGLLIIAIRCVWKGF